MDGPAQDMVSQLFHAELDAHGAVLRATAQQCHAEFMRLVTCARHCLRGGGKILVCGNGGSAADAQHIAAELVVRYRRERAPLAGLALTTDSSVLTAAGNDHGYAEVFARQVRALGRREDLLLAVTTSGRSPNVLNALQAARELGLSTAALTGSDGAHLRDLADVVVMVPSRSTARVQELHITLGHLLCEALDRLLFPEGGNA